jgi:hypothetical protein
VISKDCNLVGLWGRIEDPSVVYGLREIASRIGVDVTPIDRNLNFGQDVARKFSTLIVPETSIVDEQLVHELVKRTDTSLILVGPDKSSEVDQLFGVKMLNTWDAFPDVSGWVQTPGTSKSIPLFYSIPVLKTLGPETRVFCEIEAAGIHFPAIVMKTQGRQCLVRVGPQIFRSTVFLLTLSGMRASENANLHHMDPLGRLKLESTLAHLRGYLRTPVVDCYAKVLELILGEMAFLRGHPFIQKWPVPGPQEFCMALSHDVDFLAPKTSEFIPSLFWGLFSRNLARATARMILGALYVLSALLTCNRDFLALIPASVHRILRSYEPYWRLEEIARSEEQLGARSSFFFLSNLTLMDSNYSLRNRVVTEAIRELWESGFEICCHAPFEIEYHKNTLQIQKKMLEDATHSNVEGVRAHFLRLAYPETFVEYASAGFRYDSSDIFSEEVGYRASTCFPFMLYDVEHERLVSLLEIPPVIMDRTLRDRRHMNLSPELAQKLCTELLEEVASLHGALTIIWHNSGVSARPSEDRAWWRVYWSLIREGSRRGAKFMTLGELFSYYSVRQKAQLTLNAAEDGCWSIAIDSEEEYPSFALSVCLKSGEVKSAILDSRTLSNSNLSKIGKRVIVSLPLRRGRNLLSLRVT